MNKIADHVLRALARLPFQFRSGDRSYVPNTANAGPNAGFAFSTVGFTVTFADQSSDSDGSIVTWFWTFGDGSTSTLQNPSKTYALAGTYAVTLTVTDDRGASSVSSRSITLGGAGIVPATFQGVGVSNGSTGITSPVWPAHVAGDIGWSVHVGFSGSALPSPTTLAVANGFTVIDSFTTSASGVNVRVTVAWCRATSGSMASPSWNANGASNSSVLFTTRGGVSVGNPYDAGYQVATAAAAATSYTMPSINTPDTQRLVIGIEAGLLGGAGGTVSGVANASLTSVGEQFDDDRNVATNHMHIGIVSGIKAAAGASGSFTGNYDSAPYGVTSAFVFGVTPA